MLESSEEARKIFNELVSERCINYAYVRTNTSGQPITSILDLHTGATYTFEGDKVERVMPEFGSGNGMKNGRREFISFSKPEVVTSGPEYEALIAFSAYLDLSQKS